MNYYKMPILLSFFLVTLISFSGHQLWASQTMVGVIKTPAGQAPQESFKVYRNDKQVKTVTHNMTVENGDVIVPFAGKKVTLVYADTNCGEIVLTERTPVNCQTTTEAAGLFTKVGIFLARQIHGEELQPIATMTLRGGGSDSRDTSCYPADDLQLAPWPVDGTTFLYGQPLLFRFSTADNPCTEATLVIRSTAQNGGKTVEVPILLGELKSVTAPLSPGHGYEWFIRQENQTISNRFHFQTLSKETTNEIQKNLAEVEKQYPQHPSFLAQGIFLQLLSDESPALDLYGDSLRLIQLSGHDSSSIYFELTDRLFDHEGAGY